MMGTEQHREEVRAKARAELDAAWKGAVDFMLLPPAEREKQCVRGQLSYYWHDLQKRRASFLEIVNWAKEINPEECQRFIEDTLHDDRAWAEALPLK